MLPRRSRNVYHRRKSRPTKEHRHRRRHHDRRLSTSIHSLHARPHHRRQDRLRMRHGLHQLDGPGLPVRIFPKGQQRLVRLHATFDAELRDRSCVLDRLRFLDPQLRLRLARPGNIAMRLSISDAFHRLRTAREPALARRS